MTRGEPVGAFRRGLATLADSHELEFVKVTRTRSFRPRDDSEERLREYEGTPDQLAAALTDHEIVVVHGAPVSAGVLKALPHLKLVCCARGGPVNVDIEAAKGLGVAIATTPGKNAAAVAELTMALSLMLARGVRLAMTHVDTGQPLESAFDGAQFFGSELSSMRIWLIGFGRVGSEVCSRALSFGMRASVHDPFVDDRVVEGAGAKSVDLLELVSDSDIISLHARQTPDNEGVINSAQLAEFRPGSYLINTACESLIDEEAVVGSVRSGHLAGVAIDSYHHDGPLLRAVLAGEQRIIALPHIGGATYETLVRASDQIVNHIQAFAAAQTSSPTY